MIQNMQKPIFIISLILNLLFVSLAGFYIQKKGYSFSDILLKFQGVIQKEANDYLRDLPLDEYLSREYPVRHVSIFDSCTKILSKNRKNQAIVFFGDSITHNNMWNEYFPEKLTVNRGISGDVTFGLIERIDSVTTLLPKKVFLMIGTNDLWRKTEPEKVVSNTSYIIEEISKKSPLTKIYIQSLTPVRDHPQSRIENIKIVNSMLKELAKKGGYTFIDLHPHFEDNNGELAKQFTFDGLHLNGKGYELWVEQIKHYVLED